MATSQSNNALSRLPVELLTKTLSYLPPRQIASFRRVNKFCASVVDTNQDALARPHLLYHRQRLQNRLDYFLDPKLEILDSFARWASYHGGELTDPGPNAICFEGVDRLAYPLVRFLMVYSTTSPNLMFADTALGWREGIMSLFLFLVGCWQESGAVGGRGVPIAYLNRGASSTFRDTVSAQHRTSFSSKFLTLAKTRALFDGPRHASKRGEPVFQLTPKLARSGSRPFIGPQVVGMCDRVGEILDLPKAQALRDSHMTYYAKSQAIADLARKADQLSTGEELAPLEKAALISGIFLW